MTHVLCEILVYDTHARIVMTMTSNGDITPEQYGTTVTCLNNFNVSFCNLKGDIKK